VFFRSARRDDLLLLHFAGHGFLDDRNRLRLAAQDTEEELLNATALLTSNIVEIAERSHSRRTVFLIDCCYSARFFDALSARGDRSVHLQAQFPVQGKGTVVLAASGDLEYAFEDRQSSVFTRVLVDGLRSGAADTDRDGWISITDLYAFVSDRMRELGAAQTPRLIGDREGDLIIARGRRAHPAAGRATPIAGRVPNPSQRGTVPPPVKPVHPHTRRDSEVMSTGSAPLAPRQRARLDSPVRPPRKRFAENGGVIVGLTGAAVVLGGFVWLLVWLLSKADAGGMDLLLWILAAVLGVAGILAFFRRQILWGLVLIVVAILVGPGGVSIFT
jgi:hypothetical protein